MKDSSLGITSNAPEGDNAPEVFFSITYLLNDHFDADVIKDGDEFKEGNISKDSIPAAVHFLEFKLTCVPNALKCP